MVNRRRKLLRTFALLLLVLSTCYNSQSQINLDSLWSTWYNESAPDTGRVQAIHKIIRNRYLYSKPDSALYFSQLMYEFAKERGLKLEMADALNDHGVSYYFKNEYPKALDYYNQSLNIYKETDAKKRIANTLNKMGLIYMNQGNYPKALEYYQQSLKIKEEIADKRGMAITYSNIGIIYKNQGSYPKALKYLQQSLMIAKEIQDKKGMARALNNMGIIYLDQDDYTKAMDYYMQSLKIKEEISDKRGVANTLNNIGLIYMEQGDYPKALEYYQRSLVIKEEISDEKGVASYWTNVGIIYMHQEDYFKALEYFQRSFKIYGEISNNRGMAINSNYIGSVAFKRGDFNTAILWCEKGLVLSEESNVLESQKDACECLYKTYKAIGDNSTALKYHERIIILEDSLQAEETAKKLQQMEFAKQMLADSLRQEEEKLKVQMANEAQVRKKNRTRNIYIIAAVFLLIFAIGYHRRMVLVRKAKRAIDKEKDRSDNLLLNILPPEIAEELKEKGRAEARNYEKVSILFTDFKGFTQISEKLSAEELVEEINTCFQEFDAICKKHGVEKIKTIGDAYMAAGGLPVPRENSVRNTVLAGLEMMDFMIHKKQKCQDEGSLCFEMRLGIHTGSVVAGIVGITKFQYDIWGDAVNIASRMENSGEVGKVNISGSTREIIKDDPAFQFQPRGKVSTKGKGDIDMWFVEKTIDH